MLSAGVKSIISEKEKSQFNQKGYLVFPSFLEESHIQALKSDMDVLESRRKAKESGIAVLDHPVLGSLVSQPEVMEIVQELLGEEFLYHHIHSARHEAGMPSRLWHHDYEQYPQTNRSHQMIHIFYYLNGLNGEVGDLLLVPGSHRVVCERELDIFEDHDLPGSITLNQLPAGSMVIVHSALWHARRSRPGGENRPRYFIDISYCQKGIKWPGYNGGLGYEKLNQYAIEKGYDREGKYKHLFDSSQFFVKTEVADAAKKIQGSLFDGRFSQ